MLILVTLLYFLMHFHTFYNIFGTNLLTKCPVPVSVCFCPYISEKGEKFNIAGKIPKNSRNSYSSEDSKILKGGGGRGQPTPIQAATLRDQGLVTPLGRLVRWATLGALPI